MIMGTVRVIPRFESVKQATVRESGMADTVLQMPESVDDTTAMKHVEDRLQETFERSPNAGFTWKFRGPSDGGELLVLRVPEKDGGELDWRAAERELAAWL